MSFKLPVETQARAMRKSVSSPTEDTQNHMAMDREDSSGGFYLFWFKKPWQSLPY